VTRMQRVPGHALDPQALARDEDGNPIPMWKQPIRGRAAGRARCSCGEMSPVLDNGPARREWHQEHKLDVLVQLVLDSGGTSEREEATA
jgi:hypothetical protein